MDARASDRAAEEQFVAELVQARPEFKPVRGKTRRVLRRTLAPPRAWRVHVLVGAAHRRACAGDGPADALLARAFGFLDRAIADTRSPAGQNLLAASFLENVPAHGADIDTFRSRFGPHLKRRLQRYSGELH